MVTYNKTSIVRVLAVMVAALISANGAVAAERFTGKDLREILADGIRPGGDPSRPGGTHAPNYARDAAEPQFTITTSLEAAGRAASSNGGGTTSAASKTGSKTSSSGNPRKKTPATGSTQTTGRSGTTGTTGSTSGAHTAASPSGSAGPVGTEGTVATLPSSTPTATAPATGGTGALEAALSDVAGFAERERGLGLKRPVPVRFLPAAEFEARLARLRRLPSRQQAERTEGIMRALGVIAPDVDLLAELTKMAGGPASAVYEPDSGELLLPDGASNTPLLRATVAAEMTRAINDQWFGITPPGGPGTLDAARDGYRALVDGSAGRAIDKYMATLTAEERTELQAEQTRLSAQAPTGIPKAVRSVFSFPTLVGTPFVSALYNAGGSARLDTAFRSPPTTAEQLLEPARYLAGEGARSVAAPVADGVVVQEGSIGQILLGLMLSTVVDGQTAAAATKGWGGDRYVTWADGGRTCVRAAFSMDTPGDDDELGSALSEWVAQTPGAQLNGPLAVTNCA